MYHKDHCAATSLASYSPFFERCELDASLLSSSDTRQKAPLLDLAAVSVESLADLVELAQEDERERMRLQVLRQCCLPVSAVRLLQWMPSEQLPA